MKLPLPRVACPHSTSAATTSRPNPCLCALSLSQRPSSGETESASSNEAMPRHSLLSSRRMTKENLSGSGACTLFSHRVTYSLHDGGSHGMNLAMAGVMHPKTSCASIIWNWLSCNLGDWMTIIVSAYQRQIIRELIAGESRRCPKLAVFRHDLATIVDRWPGRGLGELCQVCRFWTVGTYSGAFKSVTSSSGHRCSKSSSRCKLKRTPASRQGTG